MAHPLGGSELDLYSKLVFPKTPLVGPCQSGFQQIHQKAAVPRRLELHILALQGFSKVAVGMIPDVRSWVVASTPAAAVVVEVAGDSY